MAYLEVCYLLRFSCCLSDIDFWFESIVVKNALHMISILINLFKLAVAQDMLYLGILTVGAWKECVICCFGCSVLQMWIKSCWLTVFVEFFYQYILAGFSSTSSVNCWEKFWNLQLWLDLSVSPFKSVSFFLFNIFCSSVFSEHTHLRLLCLSRLTLLSLFNVLHLIVIFFLLDINIATSAYFFL